MRRFVLDSNVYITAARDRNFGAELIRFSEQNLPRLYMHAVVVQELCTGAIGARARRFVEREIVAPFERRQRIIVPGYTAWKRSGRVVAALVERKVISAGGLARSFMNDVVIATSCREEGVTLITLNTADFERISQVERMSFTSPWPPGH